LEKIENSSFVVCLDDLQPKTRDELCRASWHGDGRNRYFDKPLQFIVYDNGRAGFMGEVK
jgi:carnitine O-acetyltransferase